MEEFFIDGRVGAGPRRHDQLCLKKKLWDKGMSWSQEAGSAQTTAPPAKVHENFGQARAGPSRWDQLGTTPVKTHENVVLFRGGPKFGRGPSWIQMMCHVEEGKSLAGPQQNRSLTTLAGALTCFTGHESCLPVHKVRRTLWVHRCLHLELKVSAASPHPTSHVNSGD